MRASAFSRTRHPSSRAHAAALWRMRPLTRACVWRRARTDVDNTLIELALHLFRNLLQRPPREFSSGLGVEAMDTMAWDTLVVRLHEEQVLETLLLLAQQIDDSSNRDWNLLLLDILGNLVDGIEPEALFSRYPAGSSFSSSSSSSSSSSRSAPAAASVSRDSPPPVRAPPSLGPSSSSPSVSCGC